MSSFTSFGAYDAKTLIPEFRGLMQNGDDINGDPRYATEEKNVETLGGVLQPAAACTLLTPSLTRPIETLARLYRRWGTNNKEVLVAASNGRLYWMLPGGNAWTQLAFPSGVSSYQSNVWSWVSYEINPDPNSDPVDVLLLSNAKDGMVMVRGDNMTVSQVATPKKFGVIERYAERIWGGAIDDDPDMLVYSAPYDPTNWKENPDIPEDGAGVIQQPSWDGDSFRALRAFGSQLIAFKKNRVWRVLGTDPGEYVFKEQYGGGAPYERTVAVDKEMILTLTDQGVAAYDGLSVAPYYQDVCKALWRRMNLNAIDNASAVIWRGKYYCAIPIDGSTINNAVVIADTASGTWLLREDVSAERFLATDDALFFTSSTTPGRLWQWHEDSWQTGQATAAATRWVTPWSDLNSKNVVKGSFEVYLLCEVQNSPITLDLSIQTEKKTKTKHYTVQPVTGRGYKQKRIHFGGTGRRFRLIIESTGGVWRLVGGLLIISETDAD